MKKGHEMIRKLPTLAVTAIAAGAVFAGCTTYKLWTESDSNQAEGTIQLSYEYRKFESPQVDERAGVELARERCGDWGFRNGAARKGEERICIDGTQSDCAKWRVVREYRCLREPAH
jgi:hypothetical protein